MCTHQASGEHNAGWPENLSISSLCSDSCSLITKTLYKCQSRESVCGDPSPCVHSPRTQRRLIRHKSFPLKDIEQNPEEVKQIQGKLCRNTMLTQRPSLTLCVDGPGCLWWSCPFGALVRLGDPGFLCIVYQSLAIFRV